MEGERRAVRWAQRFEGRYMIRLWVVCGLVSAGSVAIMYLVFGPLAAWLAG